MIRLIKNYLSAVEILRWICPVDFSLPVRFFSIMSAILDKYQLINHDSIKCSFKLIGVHSFFALAECEPQVLRSLA